MDLSVEGLRNLIALMTENELVELELEEEGKKVRLCKNRPEPAREILSVAAPALAPQVLPAVDAPSSAADGAGRAGPPEGLAEIKAPMVGTFYRSPAPEADPYVEVGDQVGLDTVVCIIEAMKVMNEITAETEGRIVEILVESGEAVEYGQPLLRIQA